MSYIDHEEKYMSQETSIRLIKLLTYIPKYPAKRSLSNFKDHLGSLGYGLAKGAYLSKIYFKSRI